MYVKISKMSTRQKHDHVRQPFACFTFVMIVFVLSMNVVDLFTIFHDCLFMLMHVYLLLWKYVSFLPNMSWPSYFVFLMSLSVMYFLALSLYVYNMLIFKRL